MFLEVFSRFIRNFDDNFVKNPPKFRSYLGEITRKIKNFGRNCKILRYKDLCTLARSATRSRSQDHVQSDVTNGIKWNLTHWCGLIRCCLTACGQMRLVESDHVRPRERIGNCLRSCDTHRHRADAPEMPEQKRHPSSPRIFGQEEYNNIRFSRERFSQKYCGGWSPRTFHAPLGRVFPANSKRWISSPSLVH